MPGKQVKIILSIVDVDALLTYASVFGTSVERTARAMLPYFAMLLVGLLLVAFIPWVTLSLPHAFNLGR
jgi:TRAP-type C4-dicarboxylate transport system permease large subunit